MMIFYIVCCYIALYSVIWLHEVGHAIFYYKYGCKKNPLRVTVPVYLFFSTPLPVDIEKANNLSKKENLYVSLGGILINSIIGIPLYLILKTNMNIIEGNYFYFLVISFTLLHFVEAMSYLVVNNIIVASDMVFIQKNHPILRVLLFFVGLIYTYIIYDLISFSPSNWKILLSVVSLLVIIFMGIGRVVFTIINRRKQS